MFINYISYDMRKAKNEYLSLIFHFVSPKKVLLLTIYVDVIFLNIING